MNRINRIPRPPRTPSNSASFADVGLGVWTVHVQMIAPAFSRVMLGLAASGVVDTPPSEGEDAALRATQEPDCRALADAVESLRAALIPTLGRAVVDAEVGR